MESSINMNIYEVLDFNTLSNLWQDFPVCCFIVWLIDSIFYNKHCMSLNKWHGKHMNILTIHFMRLVDRAVAKKFTGPRKVHNFMSGPLDPDQMNMLYSLSWPLHHPMFLVVQSSCNAALHKMAGKIRRIGLFITCRTFYCVTNDPKTNSHWKRISFSPRVNLD